MRARFLTIPIGLLLVMMALSPSALMAQNATDGDAPATVASVAPPPDDTFVYSPQGRRDPFEPLVTKEPIIAEVVKKVVRPESLKGPLEKYELKQFRLLAIMVVRGIPHAMVKAPDGKSYTVKVDDFIGMNGGIVKDIQTKIVDIDENGMRIEKSPDRIVVEEAGIDSVTGKEIVDYRYIVM